jgi:hypothetical protein
MFPNRAKSTILDNFLGFFRIFRGKGTPNGKSGKSYLLNILSNHKEKKIFLSEFFP